jgi:hypothetical protein
MGQGLHEEVVLLDEVEVVLVTVYLLAHAPLELADHDNFIIFIDSNKGRKEEGHTIINCGTSSQGIFAIT